MKRSFVGLILMAVMGFGGTWSAQDGSAAQDAGESVTDVERPLLMSHFMPWYQAPGASSGSWGWHWTMNHFNPNVEDENGRRQIASHYTPMIGAYDSADDAVLEYQVLTMKLAGIDGVIVDWYGTSSYNDYALLNAATVKLFAYAKKAGLLFAICYEDRTVDWMVDNGRVDADAEAREQGREDMLFAQAQWFGDPSYLTHEGRPLVFVFGPIYFRSADDWTAMFEGFDPAPGLVTLDNNLAFGRLGGYPWPPMNMAGGIELLPAAMESYLQLFYRNARRSEIVVGGAWPQFHDIYEEAGERSSYGYIDARGGDTLRETLAMAIEANAAIIQLTTWNDYGEGTIIEPTEETGYLFTEIVQETRASLDADFAGTPEDLPLPLRIFELRKAHAGDAAINAALDEAFAAIVAGDVAVARDIVAGME